MTDDPVALVARAVARRLVTPQRPHLVEDVDTALYQREVAARPEQDVERDVDAAQWGELLVSVANLALAAYATLRRQTAAPPPEALVRHVRQELDRSDVPAPDPADRDRIIDVTVGETLNAARMEPERGR
ncbi:hypothetical protein [Actinacidiphila sp. ITFR-21]|uniref:hypothetical protein n=1 Tax=Actinacidiphila sp. ITFR-21 TaxID=3075199 RepID=UPI00288BB525|nr:hypothetical protein [Streptomyces sp. ITFR-21]WNI15309.1 hypothetical protein RLT57_07020 [Streptomyces sp. ITFR-21]